MIGCDFFIYIHVPKTAGTWMRKAMHGKIPSEWHPFDLSQDLGFDSNRHIGASQVPEKLSKVPKLAFVRNPWDWFVSLFSMLSKDEDSKLSNNAYVFSEWMKSVGPGHYTKLVKPLIDTPSWHSSCIVRKYEEGVSKQAIDFISSTGCDLSKIADLFESLKSEPKANSWPRDHYRGYYTHDIARSVGDANAWVVKSYGYEF